MEGERGVIIALQGDPSTGKTTIANILGRALKCTTFHLDDIIEFVAPGPKPPRSTKVDALFAQAFDLLTKLVRTQTRLGMSVVVDSPLSRLSHLDKLVGLITGKDQEEGEAAAVRLIIIHCIPQTEYMWETKLRSHIDSRYKDKWYKPQTFPIGKAYLRNYKDNEIRARPVSSLVVRTSSDVEVPPPDPLVELVRRLMTSQKIQHKKLLTWMKKHGVSPLNYKRSRKWENLDGESSADEGRPRKKAKVLRGWCTDGHCLKEHHEVGTYRIISGTCEVCDEKIIDSEAVYSCSDCPMAIHEACAELHGKGTEMEYSPEDFPKFLHREVHKATYCFPKEHLCSVCTKEKGKDFSYDCGSCVFQSHLKNGMLPTILRSHKAHPEHRLYFWVRSISMADRYQCHACRKLTNFVGFSCTDGCVNYHPECALLPQPLKKHKHGGYEHDLSLEFLRTEKLEDYICNACNKTLNPDAWYYTCRLCCQEMHLDCAELELLKV